MDEAINLLQGEDDLLRFGDLLHETWNLKKTLSDSVSSSEIDEIYHKAIKNGATGGKILGAGGGGFILFFVPKELQQKVRKALDNLIYVPFKFDNSGSKVVLYQPEGLD